MIKAEAQPIRHLYPERPFVATNTSHIVRLISQGLSRKPHLSGQTPSRKHFALTCSPQRIKHNLHTFMQYQTHTSVGWFVNGSIQRADVRTSKNRSQSQESKGKKRKRKLLFCFSFCEYYFCSHSLQLLQKAIGAAFWCIQTGLPSPTRTMRGKVRHLIHNGLSV